MVYLSFVIKQTNYTAFDCVFIPLYKDVNKQNHNTKKTDTKYKI